MSRIQQGLAVNPLVPSSLFDQLDEDDEVCLVRLPNHLDTDKLYDVDIQEEFSVGDKKYTTSISSDVDGLLLGAPDTSGRVHTVHLPVERIYTVRAEFAMLPLPVFSPTPPPPYRVPQITEFFRPNRHPIYGVEVSKIKKRSKNKGQEEEEESSSKRIKVEGIKEELDEYREYHEPAPSPKEEVKEEASSDAEEDRRKEKKKKVSKSRKDFQSK